MFDINSLLIGTAIALLMSKCDCGADVFRHAAEKCDVALIIPDKSAVYVANELWVDRNLDTQSER